MLNLTPIRTKLWIAMTMLSAVLLLLAASGFWGLYRYKQLAGEVGRQAKQIPLVGRLHSLSMTMRESHIRSRQLRGRGGMIDNMMDPLFEIETLERQTFDGAATIMGTTLMRLRSVLDDSEWQSVLVNRQDQLATLTLIEDAFDQVQKTNRPIRPIHGTDYETMLQHLEILVASTDVLVTNLHEGMANFSDAVKVEYRMFIILAWMSTGTAVAIIAVLLVGFRSYVVQPFRTLLDGSRLVIEGQHSHRIELGTDDELNELAMAINGMTSHFRKLTDDLDAQVMQRSREVIRNEQLASVGFLAAGVAHEINNPLAAVAWSAESLQNQMNGATIVGVHDDDEEQPLAEELQVGLARIESEAYRCKGIIEKLLDFSRLGDVCRDAHDLGPMIRDLVEMVGKVGKYRCMNINVSGDPVAIANVNPQEIRQVMLNLLTNALESVDDDGRVEIHVATQRDRVILTVKDNGCGMTDEVREHLFEPFFTRRRDGSGTGLGLSITSRIVCSHGGLLRAESDGPGHGSTFRLELPTAETSQCSWSTTDSHRLPARETPVAIASH